MPSWLIFTAGFLVAFYLGMVAMAILIGAGRNSRAEADHSQEPTP